MAETEWETLKNMLQQQLQMLHKQLHQQVTTTMQPFVPNFHAFPFHSQTLMLGTFLLSIIPVYILKVMKNQRGYPWKEIGGLMKLVGGGQDPSQTILRLFLISKKTKCVPR